MLKKTADLQQMAAGFLILGCKDTTNCVFIYKNFIVAMPVWGVPGQCKSIGKNHPVFNSFTATALIFRF